MRHITTIGIDLAKEVFAVCALDATGAEVYSKVLKRDAFIGWGEARCKPVPVDRLVSRVEAG